MANTRFKAENGLIVVNGNSQFDTTTQFNANVTVAADQWYIGGNLYVADTKVFIGGTVATADIIAGTSGLKLANSTYQFDAYLSNVYVYGTALNPVGNTTLLGNSTNRWVISGNSLNISTTTVLTGAANALSTFGVTGAANALSTFGVTGATTLASTLSVAGAANALSTFGVAGAANALSTFGVTGATTLASTLSVAGAANALSTFGVTGAANALSTFGVTGAANALSTLGVRGVTTLASNLSVAGITTLSGNAVLSGSLQTISGNTSFNGGALFVDAINNRVGIGTTTPDRGLDVAGGFRVSLASDFGNTTTHLGAATFSNTITVTGNSTFNNTATFNANAIFNNAVTISGNLTVSGTTTYVNTQTLNVADNIVTLNADVVGAPPSEKAGIEINRGTSANAQLVWDEAATPKTWKLSSDSITYYNIVNEGTSNTSLDGGVLFVDALNNRVGINTTTPGAALNVVGNTLITDTVNAASYTVGSNFIANTSRVTISGIPLQANGSVGTQGQILASNGSIGSPYWTTVPSGSGPGGGGSSTQVQFNDATALGGSAGFTFDKTTNNVTIANTLTVGTVTATTGVFSNNFVKAQKIVAPTPIINKGTGLLTSIGATTSLGSSIFNLAVDPTGRFLYAPVSGGTTVEQYTIDQSTGALTSIGAATAGNGPRAVAVDPTGRFAYVSNFTDNSISQFSIVQATGALTALSPATVATGTSPQQNLMVDPTGRFLYIGTTTGGLAYVYQYSIDQSTGALTLIQSTLLSFATSRCSVWVDPTGRFVYAAGSASISVYRINQSTGALTIVGSATALSGTISSIAGDPTGRFVYLVDQTGSLVNQFSIDQNTGAVTSLGTVSTGSTPVYIAISPNGLYAYVVNNTGPNIQQYSINQSTGVLTSLGTTSGSGIGLSLAVDPTGRFVYGASSSIGLFLVNNLSAGSVTIAGSLTSSSNSLTLGTSSISSSGYSRLPNGLLMQWGNILANSTTASFNYPTTFSALYSTQATASNSTYHVTYTAQLIAVTTSSTTIRTANTANTTVYWTAIGT